MEKIIYIITKRNAESGDQFKESLINGFTKEINHLVGYLQINTVDSGVKEASLTRVGQEAEGQLPSKPVADGIVAVWVKSVSFNEKLEATLGSYTNTAYGYLVTESEPLENESQAYSPVRRTPGFDQVAFLKKPSNQEYDEWLYNWQSLHTQVAIDTQSTVRYIQNVIVRALTKDAPHYSAIVEEGFSEESAMFDPMVFYDAQGKKDRMLKNNKLMMESCSRFIDFQDDPTDLIAMSQYLVKK